MRINKKFIVWFNKNKSKEEYSKIYELYFSNLNKCHKCNNVVYYYDSTYLLDRQGNLKLHKKSCLSYKELDKKYYLSVCEDCITNRYPEYQDKNKSRVFNQMNYLTEFAFNIPHDVSIKWMKEKYAITEENLIRKWGEETGKNKWIQYCNKQSISNTFEYKKEKYGWTEEQFDDYNKSRSVTLENLVKRHGDENGLVIWENYCDRQKYTTSLKYFIEKHGINSGTEVYENFCKKRLFGAAYSMVSKKLFDELSKSFDGYTLYYAEKEWFSYDNINKKYYLIDFYIRELNIGIEFNGDTWHANPDKFKSTDIPISFQNKYTSQDIWDKDKIKTDYLKTKLTKLIIIWESDFYKNGMDKTIKIILKEING